MKSFHNIREVKLGFKCHEEWSEMEERNENRHCQSCDKLVFDLTKLSNEEIIDFLSKRKKQKTCGSFTQSQLHNLNYRLAQANGKNHRKLFLTATLLTTLMSCNSSKNLTSNYCEHENSKIEIIANGINSDSLKTVVIKGRIVDENDEPLIGANLVFDETTNGCSTDFDGKFDIEVKTSEIKSETVTTQYIGFENYEIKLVDIKNKDVKIVMADYGVLLGDVIIIKQPFHKRVWNGIKNIF